MPTVTEWTLAIVSDVVHFGMIIAILYMLKRFHKHRYCQALQKRSQLLVYLMNICFISCLLYHITYKIAYIYGLKDWNMDLILNSETIDHPRILSLISIFFYIFSYHGIAIMWIARSWIIYFNCQYGLEIQKSEWGVNLNNRYCDTLWFVKHRRDYGSTRVIYPIAITWYIIHALFHAFVLFRCPNIRRVYDSTSWFIELMISVIIWYKIPSFNDVFGIKKESQWILRVSAVALMLYIGYVTYRMSVLEYNLWAFMIIQFIFGIMIGIMALILNGFIFYDPNHKHLISTTLRVGRSRTLTSRTFHRISTGDKLSFSQVLENAQLIECFFLHLADEFSVELLLALIEFKQFHDFMMNDDEFMADVQEMIVATNSADTRISDNILSDISLPDQLPQSDIVYNNHLEDDEDDHTITRYLEIALDLFNKYIVSTAEFQVNLSYGCRSKIAYFIHKHSNLSCALDENERLELFILFNEASSELYRLLYSSHKRYITANKYFPTSSPMCA